VQVHVGGLGAGDFGVNIDQQVDSSELEKFVHVDKLPTPKYPYCQQRWFQRVLFLEQNFRNAIAPMHYKLFDFEKDKHPKTENL
jgi:hypothetical protein